MIKLNWEDINFEDHKIKILCSKGNKDRVVYFNGELKEIFTKCRKNTEAYKGAVVRGTFGKRISSCSLQRIVQRIYKESGVYRDGLTIHSLSYPNLNKIQTFFKKAGN